MKNHVLIAMVATFAALSVGGCAVGKGKGKAPAPAPISEPIVRKG